VPLAEKCYNIIRQALLKPVANSRINLDKTINSIYSYFLLPFANVFCFFSVDFSGFRQIARRWAVWLKKGQSLTLLRSIYLRVIIVTDKICLRAYQKKKARKAFLWLLREKTTHKLFKQISDIYIIAFFLDHKVFFKA
jgi:hypothetical protein